MRGCLCAVEVARLAEGVLAVDEIVVGGQAWAMGRS